MASLLSQQAAVDLRSANNVALLHKLECKACPLNNTVGGKLAPTGTSKPLVYILGEAPGANEVKERAQFVGESGQLLRAKIPRKYRDQLRFNNCARSRPPGNETPDKVILECCRPSVVKDIEQTKPRAILGFGNVPLDWVSGFNGITLWRGRKMPVRIGSHTCWYYPLAHPTFLLRQRRGEGLPSEEERMFAFDMQRAFAEIESLPEPSVHTAEDVRRGVEIITEFGKEGVRQVEQALKWAAEQPVIGIDYETNGIRPYTAGSKVLTAAVATGTRAIAFPFAHPEAAWTPSELAEVTSLWQNFLRTAKGIKAVHNLAFELEWTAVKFGSDLVRAGRWEDTATQACIVDERKGERKPGCFSLEFLVQQYFGFNLKKLAGVNRKDLENAPFEAVLQYNAGDAKYHCLLWEKLHQEIKREGLQHAYKLALRSVPTVVLTQVKGLLVNQTEVASLQKKYAEKLVEAEAKIKGLDVVKAFQRKRGQAFKPLSNQDVLYVFKDMLNRSEVLVEDKYTKKQKYSADEKVLEQIEHPLAAALLDLRHFTKRKSTYVDPLAPGSPILYPDGCLHAQFNTIFAETGRTSCDAPNLQNFPKRDSEAKEVRKQIVPPDGCSILAFDYGQIEARVIAMFTKDKRFCKALWERYDVHLEWAERLARAYPARVGGKKNLTDKKAMKDFRTDVKNQWTFPLFFGARVQSAAGYLKIPEQVVRPLYKEFWEQFSGVKAWQEKQLEFYHEHGYVEGLTGRRRRGPLSLNQVFNSPVQGTAAAIVIDAMSRLSELGDPELQPEINIHDDLTFIRIPKHRVDAVAERVITEMLKVPFPWVNVPITVEGSIGPNWLEMEEFGAFSSDEWFK